MYGVRPVSNLTSDRSLVEQVPVALGGRSAPPDGLATEVAALAGLLAEVVGKAQSSPAAGRQSRSWRSNTRVCARPYLRRSTRDEHAGPDGD